MKKFSAVEYLHRIILESMNFLPVLWAEQFDNIPEFPFSFSLSKDGLLCFADRELCQIEEASLRDTEVEVVYFGFETISGDRFIFLVDWPFDSPIRSVEILKNGKRLFLCESPEHT